MNSKKLIKEVTGQYENEDVFSNLARLILVQLVLCAR